MTYQWECYKTLNAQNVYDLWRTKTQGIAKLPYVDRKNQYCWWLILVI